MIEKDKIYSKGEIVRLGNNAQTAVISGYFHALEMILGALNLLTLQMCAFSLGIYQSKRLQWNSTNIRLTEFETTLIE